MIKLNSNNMEQDYDGAEHYPLLKVLVGIGLGSRRKIANAIKQGTVKVNGKSVDNFSLPVDLNTDIVTISLRDKVKKAINRGELNVIGVLPNGKGRPTLVHVFGPITKSVIDEAKNKGVHLNRELLVEMVNINSSSNKESIVIVNVDTTKNNSVNV